MKKLCIAFALLSVALCAWPSSSAHAATQKGIKLSGTSWTAVIGREDPWNKYTDLVFVDNQKFYEVNYVYYDSDMNAGHALISIVEGRYTLTGNLLRRTGTIAGYDRTTGKRSLAPYTSEYSIDPSVPGGLRIFSGSAKGLIYKAARPREDWSEWLGFDGKNYSP